MCGIAGGLEPPKEQLRNMLERMHHCGPHERDQRTITNASLPQAPLSTLNIDSLGRQLASLLILRLWLNSFHP